MKKEGTWRGKKDGKKGGKNVVRVTGTENGANNPRANVECSKLGGGGGRETGGLSGDSGENGDGHPKHVKKKKKKQQKTMTDLCADTAGDVRWIGRTEKPHEDCDVGRKG